MSFSGAASGIAAMVEAKKARKFTKKMMKNKYQWQVADLLAAGLNPILGYANPPPIGPSPLATGGSGGGDASIVALAKVRSETDLLRAQTSAVTAAGAKTVAETRNILTDPKKAFFRSVLEGKPVKKLTLSVDSFQKQLGSVMSEQWQNAAERWKRGFNLDSLKSAAPRRSRY